MEEEKRLLRPSSGSRKISRRQLRPLPGLTGAVNSDEDSFEPSDPEFLYQQSATYDADNDGFYGSPECVLPDIYHARISDARLEKAREEAVRLAAARRRALPVVRLVPKDPKDIRLLVPKVPKGSEEERTKFRDEQARKVLAVIILFLLSPLGAGPVGTSIVAFVGLVVSICLVLVGICTRTKGERNRALCWAAGCGVAGIGCVVVSVAGWAVVGLALLPWWGARHGKRVG